MTATKFSLVFVALVLLLPGCSRRSPSVTNVQTSRQQHLAVPAIGDTADYAMVTTVRVTSKPASDVQLTGHKKITVTKATDHGRSIPSYIIRTFEVKEESVQRLNGRSRSGTVIIWLGVDKSGNTYLLGESLDGTSWDLVTDTDLPLYMPREIKPGSSWQYTAHFASGNTESSANTCVGADEIKAPAGNFRALKVNSTFSRTGVRGTDVSSNNYVWFSTGIPYVFEVKSESDSTFGVQDMPVESRLVVELRSFRRGR